MPYQYRGTVAPLGQGLVGGVNTALSLLDYKHQRGRQEKQDKRADELYQLQIKDRERRHTIQDEDRERTYSRQDEQDARASELHDARIKNYALRDHINQFDFVNTRDEKNRERLSHAMSFMEDFYDMQEGNDDIEGPKFIKSMNGLFGELIGDGKEIRGIIGDDDKRGIMLDLDVDDEKGGKRAAPMTMNRSGDPDDQVVILPWSEMFGAVEELDAKLKEAGYDMSTKESRTKAFDALQGLTGNTGRKQKRQELKLKQQGKAPTLSADERMIRDVMANWTYSDGSKPTYQQAFQIVRTGSKPQIKRESEIRYWTKFYENQFDDALSSTERTEAKDKWAAEHPEEKFSRAKWSREQATRTLEEIIAQTRDPALNDQAASPPRAPDAAIEYLKQHPELAPQFQEKYGYLPEGVEGYQP